MFTKIFKRESNPKDVLSEIQSLKTDVCKYKEEHQRNQLIIEKMEQKINQQQIEIFKLKKKLKKSKNNTSSLIHKKPQQAEIKISFSNKSKSDFQLPDKNKNKSCPDLKKIENKEEKNNQRKMMKLMGSENQIFTDQAENFDPFLSVFSLKSRPSIIVKQLDIVNPKTSLTTMEEFAQDLKFYCPSIFKEIKNFINKRNSPPFSGEIYDFIDKMMVILRGSKELLTKYKEDNKILALIEDLIFEILYPKLFNTDEDLIAKSIEIQEKLLVLQNMITPDLLEIPKQCRLPSFLLHLQNELKKINERKSPLNKLKVISNCFDNMINLYENYSSHSKKPNADDLFPILIYLILNSNPDNLYSNIDYIYKYVRQSHLIGEYGYLLTNIIAAMSFLENLDGNSLNNGKLLINSNKILL